MNSYGKEKRPFLFAINFEITEGIFIDNPLENKDVFFCIGAKGNYLANNYKKRVNSHFNYIPLPYSLYKEKFDIIHNGLKQGYSYLTNLTIKTPISFDISLYDIFVQSTAPYKILLPERFVCFSPERFVRIEGRSISTNPMKGTIDASIPNAEHVILNDFKETAEHNTIVDLLRNDLSMVANNVRVSRFRYIDKIKSNKSEILQVSSEITGILKDEYVNRYGDIIFSMLPAGSVSGAPKNATLDLIKQAEQEPRGYYTGIFGYFDGTELDTGVMIRFIEKDGDSYYFRSGGGITAYSDSKGEYQEVLDKIYLPIL